MKKIRMLVTMSSTIHGVPPEGGECIVTDKVAEGFMFSRIATLVDHPEAKDERKKDATENSTDRE